MSLQGGIYFICCHPPAGSSSALCNPLLSSFSSLSAAIWKTPTGTDKWGFNPVLVWGRLLTKCSWKVIPSAFLCRDCSINSVHARQQFLTVHHPEEHCTIGASNVQLLQSTYLKISYSRVLSWLWPVVSMWEHNLEQHWEKECFSYNSIGNINFSQGEAVGG